VIDQILSSSIFQIELYSPAFLELILRGVFNFIFSFLIIHYCYLKNQSFNDNAFSYYAFSLIVFFICHLMGNVQLDIGLAFGLFAIFSILRYRTNSIPVREMTYLFVVMGLSVINALANDHLSLSELVFTNVVIFAFMYIFERFRVLPVVNKDKKPLMKMDIIHNSILNIKPENHDALKAELKAIVGVNIKSIKVQKTDMINQTAVITIFYN
jgi:hypothetical protein